MKLRLGVILITLIFLSGCKSKIYFPIPKLDDIDSVAYHISELSVDSDPSPLSSSNENDKRIILKLIDFLEKAKVEGYDSKVPTPSVITHYATIFLKSGIRYNLVPGSNHIVYISNSSNNKTTRMISEELNDWLISGWSNDLNK